MKPAPFTYGRPTSVQAALSMLRSGGEDTKLLAGGQSLVPMLNLRMASVGSLVDLNGLNELDYIEKSSMALKCGAMTRHRGVEQSVDVAECEPLLVRAAAEVGHLAIKNRGTVGGSIVHADPAAEWPLIATTLNADLVLRSEGKNRTVGAREFFIGPLMTIIEADEILCEIRFPIVHEPRLWGFQELCRRPGDFAIVAVACVITLDGRGKCQSAMLGVGGAHSTPLHATDAEQVLKGSGCDERAVRAAADAAAAMVDPSGDVHGSADYRRRMVAVLTRRAIQEALAKRG